MSNVHIPDKLDQLSKKELIEVAKIMHETNVDLHSQLAKANERVASLSLIIDEVCSAVQTNDEGNEPFIEVEKSLAALIFDDQERSKVLNKFAIEQQIKGATDYTAYCQYSPTDSNRKEWAEQLRKEQSERVE